MAYFNCANTTRNVSCASATAGCSVNNACDRVCENDSSIENNTNSSCTCEDVCAEQSAPQGCPNDFTCSCNGESNSFQDCGCSCPCGGSCPTDQLKSVLLIVALVLLLIALL